MTSKAQRSEHIISWALAAFVIAFDQITKQLAVSRLADGAVDVVWTLKFRLTFNSGMAFGAGSSFGPVIAIGAFVVVLFLAKSVPTASSDQSTSDWGSCRRRKWKSARPVVPIPWVSSWIGR